MGEPLRPEHRGTKTITVELQITIPASASPVELMKRLNAALRWANGQIRPAAPGREADTLTGTDFTLKDPFIRRISLRP